MILTCCLCKKQFKVKDPLINLCNKCARKSTKLLKKINKQSYINLNYSDFLKIQKKNPRENIKFNEYIRFYFGEKDGVFKK